MFLLISTKRHKYSTTLIFGNQQAAFSSLFGHRIGTFSNGGDSVVVAPDAPGWLTKHLPLPSPFRTVATPQAWPTLPEGNDWLARRPTR